MIFLPLSFVAAGIIFGAGVLYLLSSGSPTLDQFLEGTSIKAFASWLLATNVVGIIGLLVISIIVPRPKVIWFNLIYVWIGSLLALIGSNAFFLYFTYQGEQIQIGQPTDIVGAMLILVLASLFCSHRIEAISQNEK